MSSMMGTNGMPRPGRGMDAMAAMMGGLGLPPAPPPGGPIAGPGGLPIGGTPPPQGQPPSSPLLAALLGMQPADDPSGDAGMPPDPSQGDPGNDPGQLLSLLALLSQGGGGGSMMPPGPGGMGMGG